MERKGLDALTDGGHNQANADKVKANKGYIIGLPFSEYIDLSRQKFSVQITSSATNLVANPRSVYLYFLSLLKL